MKGKHEMSCEDGSFMNVARDRVQWRTKSIPVSNPIVMCWRWLSRDILLLCKIWHSTVFFFIRVFSLYKNITLLRTSLQHFCFMMLPDVFWKVLRFCPVVLLLSDFEDGQVCTKSQAPDRPGNHILKHGALHFWVFVFEIASGHTSEACNFEILDFWKALER